MSLLLDALKRAEQEKLTRQGDRRPDAEAAQGAPAASLELQALPSAGAARSEAEVAQAVFKAKTASSAPRARGALWAVVGAAAVVLLAAAAYVWHSIQSLSPAPVPLARARLSALPPPAPASPADASARRSDGGSPAPVGTGARTPALEEVSAPPPAAPEPAQAAAPAAAPAREVSAASRVEQAAVPESAPPLKLARMEEKPRVPPEVTAGYEALRKGNLEAARRSYAAALANDPANVDAQLGLATVEARVGERSAAALHYREVLAADPRNATALAGLAALAQDARPEAVESQLRAEIARSPDSAALHFALGDLYAAHSRWSDAQAEFFEAHRLDPGNADAAYNLAVSLDHLGQSRLAADFYRRALEGAGEQSAQFDAAGAARRLSELR